MPRPPPADADLHPRLTALARGTPLLAALLATAAGLVVAGFAVLPGDASRPGVAAPWLLAAGMACTVAGVAWVLWRQRDLAEQLRAARLEARGLISLAAAWHWRSDAAHRLTQLHPPATAPDPEWARPGTLGQPLWEHFDADPVAAAALRARLEAGTPLDGQKVWRRLADGSLQPFELRGFALSDPQGRATGHLGNARALGAEATAGADPSLRQALLSALPWPVVVLGGTDDAPTHVEFGNDSAAQWLGLKPNQLAGLALSELPSRLAPDLQAALAQAMATAAAGKEPPADASVEVQLRRVPSVRPSGNAGPGAGKRWVLTRHPPRPAPARAAPPPPAAVAAEQESFSYTVSHDLRAPIRVVEGFTKILKEDYGRQLDRIGNDHLDRVLGAAARMNSMVDALLALSQLSSRPLSRQPVNLSQLATYVVEDLRRQAPERAVAVHIEPGLQTQGDPTLLRMVLENLLGNAWKYSAKKPAAQIWLERGLHDGQPVYTVRDNGAGFDMRFADRLFGVFQRLHSATDFPGTGVGLASVRRIVSRHGGEIWAESAVERGSSFHFTLPAGNAQA